MDASLDTNVIIHLYRSNNQSLLFELFDKVYVCDFILNVELINHGKDIINLAINDIANGNIINYTNQMLKEFGMYNEYVNLVEDQKLLYGTKDMGEIHAIALAKILNANVLVTNDIKLGGPYRTCIMDDYDETIPFNTFEVLLFSYLKNLIRKEEVIEYFNSINEVNNLSFKINQSLKETLNRFIKSSKKIETDFFEAFCKKYNCDYKSKIKELYNLIKSSV